MWRSLALIALLLRGSSLHSVAAVPAPSPSPQSQESACGPDAPDGLILHQAFTEDGSLADPPLALLNPITGESRPVNVPDPRKWTAAGGCFAIVWSADQSMHVVDGETASVTLASLPDPPREWEYFPAVGGVEHGLLLADPYGGTPSASLITLATGELVDLSPLITLGYSFYDPLVNYPWFSPSGRYLLFPDGDFQDATIWLLPTSSPTAARSLSFPAVRSSIPGRFDHLEERLLYIASMEGVRKVVIEDIETGETMFLPGDAGIDAVDAWFLPGPGDRIAVLTRGHLELIDLAGSGPPVRLAAMNYESPPDLYVSSEGNRAVLQTFEATVLIDLTEGIARELTVEGGQTVRRGYGTGRWRLVRIGPAGQPVTGEGVLDMETGTYSHLGPLAATADGPGPRSLSDDGHAMLLVDRNEDGSETVRFVSGPSGTVSTLGTADTITCAVSPSGQRSIYATVTRTEEGPVRELVLVDGAGGTATSFGQGFDPVWLGP